MISEVSPSYFSMDMILDFFGNSTVSSVFGKLKIGNNPMKNFAVNFSNQHPLFLLLPLSV